MNTLFIKLPSGRIFNIAHIVKTFSKHETQDEAAYLDIYTSDGTSSTLHGDDMRRMAEYLESIAI